MSRRTSTNCAPHRPPGAWRRFFVASVALVVVLVGVPVLLVVCSRVGLDASHPFPRIGTTDEVTAFFERDLTPTEIAPIAMRALLIVGWLLWLGMAMSVVASILEARGGGRRAALPQFAMFAGLGRWIAAGLTAVSALAPNFVSAGSLASPRPFTVSSAMPAAASVVEAPVRAGFARVQRGESVETFAQRTLGDATRWSEIWDLNKNQAVGQDGESWTVVWKLAAGWDLRLPASGLATPTGAFGSGTAIGAENEGVIRHSVVSGDSYWSIARSQLGDGAPGTTVWDLTQALMEMNAPRLGYDDPAMLHPGDVVDIIVPQIVATTVAAVEQARADEPAMAPRVTVEAGDSYWAIAEESLGPAATAAAVSDLTNDLVDLNSPLLGYDVRPLIHPGDTVYLQDPTAFEPPVEAATVNEVEAPLEPVDPSDEVAIGELQGAALDTTPSTTIPTTTIAPTTTSSTIPPAGPSGPSSANDVDGRRPAPLPVGIGEAALLATGVIALLAARRRSRLRAAEPPARMPLPRPETAATEQMLRRLEDGERLLRVDIALRAAAAAISDREHRVVVVRSSPDGTIELSTTGAVTLPEPWIGSATTWMLPRLVSIDELAAAARTVGVPCIALVQIGVDDHGWDVLVDLEAVGLLAVDVEGPTADCVVRAIAVGLASSEFAEVAHLVGVGVDAAAFLGHRHAQIVESLDEGIELAATLVGPTMSATRSTFALRARHTGGEVWEPAVVIVASTEATAIAPGIVATLSGRGGVAVVAGAAIAGAVWNLHADGDMWVLDPLGIRLLPVGIETQELDELLEAIDGDHVEPDVADTGPVEPVLGDPGVVHVASSHALLVSDPHVAVMDLPVPSGEAPIIPTVVIAPDGPPDWSGHGGANGHDALDGHDRKIRHNGNGDETGLTTVRVTAAADGNSGFADPPWSLMVRLMGAVDLVDASGDSAQFERSKTLELITWMVTHRHGSTRTAARTALWDQDVRDATFANVVSEARRAMARHVDPAEGDEWLRRTLTDELSLHEGVVSDADLLRRRFEAARTKTGDDALMTLKPAVELVMGLPFAGTSYLWPETEGIASNLVVLATNVTADYARRALAAGDFEGVFWATSQGLKVLAGQEALIALRMRAHAGAGDLSGVRHEWETYERVINADPWSDGEPAAKLVALRRELLSK